METLHELDTIPVGKHHYGVASFIERNKSKDLSIFVIDDNEAYLQLLKNMLDQENFSVFTFTTGEEALDYLQIRPELVIIDIHLNSQDPTAMDGDRIAELIHQRVPETEIALISGDKKLNLISELHSSLIQNIIYKDENAMEKIIDVSEKVALKVNNKHRSYKGAFIVMIIILVVENSILILQLWTQNY
jgi:CheY-like chemotaxis protein